MTDHLLMHFVSLKSVTVLWMRTCSAYARVPCRHPVTKRLLFRVAHSLWSHQTLTFAPGSLALLPVAVMHCTQALVTPKHRSRLSSLKDYQLRQTSSRIMAAAPPLPPQVQPQPPAPPAVGPCTYQELYSNATNDQWGGDYATLMAQYATVPAILTPPELLLTRPITPKYLK